MFGLRGVQCLLSMMRKVIMVEVGGGESIKHQNWGIYNYFEMGEYAISIIGLGGWTDAPVWPTTLAKLNCEDFANNRHNHLMNVVSTGKV